MANVIGRFCNARDDITGDRNTRLLVLHAQLAAELSISHRNILVGFYCRRFRSYFNNFIDGKLSEYKSSGLEPHEKLKI